MELANQQSPAGIYIVFGIDESIVNKILDGRSGYQTLNLAMQDSFKVPIYFEKEKLKWIPGIVSSRSGHPNYLFSSLLHLLQKTDFLVVGTIGLSNASLLEILDHFIKNVPVGKWLFFIDSTGDYLIENPIVKVTGDSIKDLEAILTQTTLKCSFPKFSFKLH
jgi:hypothetical protein